MPTADSPAALDPAANPAELAALALQVASEAADFIVHARPTDLGVSSTKSSETDIVTAMDQASQDLLRGRLAELRADDGFHGEEDAGAATRSGITWVVDPIDGTVNYLYDLPAYSVSVAAVVGDPSTPGQWRPLAGAVVNPISGEAFHAAVGQGAHKSLRGTTVGARAGRLEVSGRGPSHLGQALCGTGFGYDSTRRAWQGSVLALLLPQVRDIRRFGSAALDLCRVAEGSLDVYYERGLNPWDMAAGWLIAAEAGALVSDLAGGDPTPSMTVAGGPEVHPALREALAAAIAEVGDEAS